jgi:cobalt-zinc-cadmium efflux system outer membrane protein
MRHDLRVVVGCLFALAAMSPAQAQDRLSAPGTAALTVDQAVREALDRNLSLLAERYNVTVAQAAIVTASLRPNPVVTVSLMRPDKVLVDAGISPNEQVFHTDYLIERGGKRERRVEQATLARSVAELQLLNTTRALVLDVQNAFVDVQLATASLALANDNLGAFNNVVRINTERVRTGDLSKVELSRSQLAAVQFQNDVRRQETKLRVARNRLSTLIGRGPDGSTLEVTGELRHDTPSAPDLMTLRTRALATRPDLLAARSDQARSAADLRLQLANGKVDVTVSGEYHHQEGFDVSGNSYGAFLSVPLPLFNRNQGDIARAKAQTQQLDTRVRALEIDVANDVATAVAEFTTARDIVDTIETQMLEQARSVRSATEYSYRGGEASFVEFLDAVRAFNDTMQSYNEARADYARSLYALDSISAKVNP